MTQREYERLRTSKYYRGYSSRQQGSDRNQPEDGYFAFFKLRCLICLVLFLGMVAVDRRIDARENQNVKQVMNYLNQDKIPANGIWKD